MQQVTVDLQPTVRTGLPAPTKIAKNFAFTLRHLQNCKPNRKSKANAPAYNMAD
jgi:hypothetical protein